MFYLIQFFKTFSLSPIKSIFFWIFTFLTCLIISFSSELNLLAKNMLLGNERPYFHALLEIQGESQVDLKALKRFSGVEKVNLLSEMEMTQLWEKSLKDLSLTSEVSQQFNPSQFMGLQIFVNESLNEKSLKDLQEEIKNYLGEDKLTLSAVNLKKKRSDLFVFFVDYFAQILTTIFFVFWLIFFFNWSELVKKNSYLIEKYSRRKNVGFKITFIGLFFLIALSFTPSFVFNRPNLIESSIVAVLLMMSSFWFFKSWKWSE